MKRRAFLKALLAVPAAAVAMPLTAQAVTTALPDHAWTQSEHQWILMGNLHVAAPRYSRILYGICEP